VGFFPKVVWANLKKSLFQKKQKIEIWFSRFVYTLKALNHSIIINEMKAMRSFSL